MEAIDKTLVKFNQHLNDQTVKAYDISNSEGKSVAAWSKNTVKSIGYNLAINVERLAEILALTTMFTASLGALAAAIFLSPSLLSKSNNAVKDFVNKVFHLIKVEAAMAKEIAMNLAPLSINSNITQAFVDQAQKYFKGIDTQVDYKKAFAFAEVAARHNNAEAQFIIGMLYHMDQAPKHAIPAEELSILYLELAAKQGHPEAINKLYEINKFGEYNKYLLKAAEINNPEALFDCAYREKDPVEAKKYYQKAADLGHTKALYHLAMMGEKELTSYEGEDLVKVLDLYSKAIEINKDDPSVYFIMYRKAELLENAGHLEEAVAQYNAADHAQSMSCHAINGHLPRLKEFTMAKLHLQKGNTKEAIEILSKIQNTNIKAKILLANTHFKEKNFSEAVEIYNDLINTWISAESLSEENTKTLISILNILYPLYYHGADGFESNLEDARYFASLLAQYDESKENMHNFGAMLVLGQGGAVERKIGYEYLQIALEKGNADTAFLIGQLDVEAPHSDPKSSRIMGLIYLKVAEKMGHPKAGKMFERYAMMSKSLLKASIEKENHLRQKYDEALLLKGELSEIVEIESEKVLMTINKE